MRKGILDFVLADPVLPRAGPHEHDIVTVGKGGKHAVDIGGVERLLLRFPQLPDSIDRRLINLRQR